MNRLGAGLALATAVLAVFPFMASAAKAPSIRASSSAAVLTLTGSGFAPRERVQLAVVADRTYRGHIAVTSRGTFTFRLAGAPRCAAWRATATGSRTGRKIFRSGVVDCSRNVDPGSSTASAPAPTPAPVVGTGVAGFVHRSPACEAELPCAGPAAGVVVEIVDAHGTVVRTITGNDGRFAAVVPPGTYTVRTVGLRARSVSVEVRAGTFADVTISVDSGVL